MRTSRVGIWTDRGFSLIELLVACSIIAVLVAVFVPLLYRTPSLEDEARRLIGAVRSAYAQAIGSRQMQWLCLDLTEARYWLSAEACDHHNAAASPAMVPRRLSADVRFLDVDLQRGSQIRTGLAAIRFFPIGMAERTVIHLEDRSSHRLSLTIHPLTGLVASHDGYVSESLEHGEHGR
jgi:prepilin-type N-terminal cleavage/methylation domain-containing protein